MDAQRNRASLEELRQVVEDELENHPEGRDVELRNTTCLGVCKPGHVMGVADDATGGYLFNAMDAEEPVRQFVRSVLEGKSTGNYTFPDELSLKIEGRISPGMIDQIPWRES